MTAFEVAELAGCHEESVRRAYLSGQLRRQRFGVRSWWFLPADVQDWIAREGGQSVASRGELSVICQSRPKTANQMCEIPTVGSQADHVQGSQPQ